MGVFAKILFSSLQGLNPVNIQAPEVAQSEILNLSGADLIRRKHVYPPWEQSHKSHNTLYIIFGRTRYI